LKIHLKFSIVKDVIFIKEIEGNFEEMKSYSSGFKIPEKAVRINAM